MLTQLKNFLLKKDSYRRFYLRASRHFDFFVTQKMKNFFSKNQDKKMIFDLSDKRMPSAKQFRQIKHFFTEKEKKLFNICVFVFLLSSIWFCSRLVLSRMIERPVYGGEYTEGLVGSLQYINPTLSQSNDADRDISKLIFSGLFKIDKDGKLQKDLIEDYSIEEGGKVYNFKLRHGILWHDGVTLTAEDIGFTLSIIQDANYKSPLYRTFQGVVFEKQSEDTFKLTLQESFDLVSLLTFGVLPEHAWQGITYENYMLTELNKKPIGSGPFKFDSFKKDSNGIIKQYKVVSNDAYYDKKPYINSINFRFYADVEGLIEALNNNQVDAISSVSKYDFSKVKGLKNKFINSFDTPKYSALFFNPGQNGFLKDTKVREALSLSINKKDLIGYTGIKDSEAYGPLDFIITPEEDKYDIEMSKKLLSDYGFKMDEKENVLKKGSEKFEITITSVDNDEYKKILEYIKQQWSALGIVVNIEIISRQKINTQVIIPRQYQVLLHGQLLSYDTDPYPFWHSSQMQNGLNLSLLANSDIDTILEAARKTSNFDEKLEKYQKFEDILKQQYFAIFLFRPQFNYIFSKNIKGIDTKVVYLPSDRFSNVTNWYIRSKKSIK